MAVAIIIRGESAAANVAALRAMLVGDFDEHWRLADQIHTADWVHYHALLVAAFVTAVERRFGQETTGSEIVQFIADTRTRLGESAAGIDPSVAERLVLAALGRTDLDGSDDDDMVIRVQTTLLATLISAENLDDAGLDDFLKDALELVNEWSE